MPQIQLPQIPCSPSSPITSIAFWSGTISLSFFSYCPMTAGILNGVVVLVGGQFNG